jgi:hypothetical protein
MFVRELGLLSGAAGRLCRSNLLSVCLVNLKHDLLLLLWISSLAMPWAGPASPHPAAYNLECLYDVVLLLRAFPVPVPICPLETSHWN